MIEHLRSRTTTFLQVRKINEIIDAIKSFRDAAEGTGVNGLINQYTNRINQMKDYLTNTVPTSIDDLLAFINNKLSGYYTKQESDNKFLNKNNVGDYLRYDDLNLNGNLTINSGNQPAIKFNKSSGVLFTIDGVDISVWPFVIAKDNNKYLEINNSGLATDKTIITKNNYRKFIKLPQWKDGNSIGESNKNDWREVYAYNPYKNDFHTVFFMIKDAYKRRYNPYEVSDSSSPMTNMSVSFQNYYGGDKNYQTISRIDQNPWNWKFEVHEIWRQRKKHHSSYSDYWDGLGGYIIKCR
jgi:hypothetical protein